MSLDEDYWKLAEQEQAFNSIQIWVRGLASTWILGAFAAIGWVLQTTATEGLLLSRILLVFAVSTMATLGLFLLWILDQMVYHRLLNSVFLIGLKMEYDHAELPPIRALMMAGAEGTGMAKWISVYYWVPIGGFALISAGATAWYVLEGGGVLWLLMALVVLGSFGGVAGVIRLSRSEQHLARYAALFGDDKFIGLFTAKGDGSTGFRQITSNRTRAPK